ncbi:MAG: hypothetical protein V1494_08265 [Candidatus Diapherotrites archaeon]
MPKVRERLRRAKEVGKLAGKAIEDKAREKWLKAKSDPRFIAIEVIQLLLILTFMFAFAVYLLRDTDTLIKIVVALQQHGLVDPSIAPQAFLQSIPEAPWSYIIFAVWVAAIFYVMRFTQEFRSKIQSEPVIKKLEKRIRKKK